MKKIEINDYRVFIESETYVHDEVEMLREIGNHILRLAREKELALFKEREAVKVWGEGAV